MRRHRVTFMAVLLGCGLDTSGSGGEGDSSGTTATSSDTAPTSASTVPSTDTATEPTSADGTMGTTASTSATTDDGSTGELEFGPFDVIEPLDELNSPGDDDDPSMRGDGLEIYFASDRGGMGEDLYRAVRRSTADPFDAPEPVDALNLPNVAESTPELSPDGLTLYFASSRPGLGALDVYVTVREGTDDDWEMPERVDDVSSEFGEGAPVITGDGRTAYLCRGQQAGGTELFRGVRRDPTDPFEVALLESISTAFEDCSPWITAAGDELWFASDRPDGAGGYDLWRVAVDGGEPGEPENVAELNVEGGDDDPWLSADGSTLLFASDRDGNYDLFIATRSLR